MPSGSRAERIRENWILLHVLLISCILVIGLWICFDVIPLPGALTRWRWQEAYWTAKDGRGRMEALDHLRAQFDGETDRIFTDARRRGLLDPAEERGP